MTDETLLQTRSLTKEFRGFRAVSEVDLVVQTGTVHALVGPNGAGKTTLQPPHRVPHPTSGTIEYDGQDITGKRPEDIAHLGIARSFQITSPRRRSPSGSTSSWRWPAAPGSGCGSGSR